MRVGLLAACTFVVSCTDLGTPDGSVSRVATIVVAKWTGELDVKRLEAGLNNETWIEAEAPEEMLDEKVAQMAVSGK